MVMDRTVVLTEVTRTYQSRRGRVTAVAGLSLSVAPGTVLGLVGRSGSGKSTTLRLIAGLERPDAGQVLVCGQAVEGLGARQRARLRREHVGFVFQDYNLLPELTAVENVMLALEVKGAPARSRRVDALEALAEFGLADLARRFPAEMSGGEQQRVAVARAVAARTNVLLADEPTGSLDDANAELVGRTLRAAAVRGATVLVATHDPVLLGFVDTQLRLPTAAEPAIEQTQAAV
jgi:putative ABC transport system ATP-binding protein